MEREISGRPGHLADVEIAVGRALDWHLAGWGRFAEGISHIFASCEVDSIAGLGEIDTFGAVAIWEVLRQAALGLLSGAALMPGCNALELRYIAVPDPPGPSLVRMFITAKTRGYAPEVAVAAVTAACDALPRGFSHSGPADIRTSDPTRGLPVIELRRHEEVTIPQWDYVPADFYYTINDDPGDGSGWPTFWRVLSQVAGLVSISLLFSCTELDWDERNALAGITSDLNVVAFPHTDFDVLGQQVNYPADMNAKIALDSWTRRIAQLQRPLLARVAVRAEPEVGAPVAAALSSAIAASAGPDTTALPMSVERPESARDVRQAAFGFDWLEVLPWGGHPIWAADSAPHILRRLPYLFGVKAAAGLAVLPVPDEQGVPGFRRARLAAIRRSALPGDAGSEPGIVLGRVLHLGKPAAELVLPLTAVNRHVLVVGAPGSGKTTTVLSLLTRLWRKHQVPFFVIEPTKTEYRSLLRVPGLEDLRVISLGRDDVSPLRLNPLAPPPGVRREVHAGAVMAALKLALPLPPPLPQLLEDALDHVFDQAGWAEQTILEDGVTPPTLRGLLDSFDIIFAQQGYVGEARNIASAVRVRLRSLLRGSRGRVLDTVESVDFDALMRRPVVIELDEVADASDKAVLSAFLLDRIRAAARARGSTRGRLAHVTVIEEAHRLLGQAAEHARDTTGGDNARADAVRSFTEAIAELRALGQGFILSSQSPAALAEAVLASTGTRVLHRLESSRDRDIVLNDLGARQTEREAAARLRQGEAVIRWPERDDAELLLVAAAPGVDSGHRVTDQEVADRMAEHTEVTRRLLPHPLCTRSMCTQGCEPAIRAEGSRVAAQAGAAARNAWAEANGTARALRPIVSILTGHVGSDAQRAYCAAVHLAVAGDAFKIARRADIRPQLVKTIREAAKHEP